MLIDIYGSRSNLLNIIQVQNELSLVISNIYIGTTIESQMFKNVLIDETKLENISSPYELLEINTDFSKRFRNHNFFPKSNAIILDFMHEGRQSIKFKNGSLVNRPVLRRYGYSQGNGKTFSLDQKINNIEKYVEELVSYLSDYDLIIINKMRNPKFEMNESSELQMLENLQEINFLNYYAETFEDILMSKIENIEVIPSYKNTNDLSLGYLNDDDYLEYMKKNMKKILSKYN